MTLKKIIFYNSLFIFIIAISFFISDKDEIKYNEVDILKINEMITIIGGSCQDCCPQWGIPTDCTIITNCWPGDPTRECSYKGIEESGNCRIRLWMYSTSCSGTYKNGKLYVCN